MEATQAGADDSPAGSVGTLEAVFGLTSDDLARALDVDTRTVARWRAGISMPQHEARRRLQELLALSRRVQSTFVDGEAARAWMHQPNKYLRGLTPADALRVGRPDRVHAALEIIDAGVYV